jgi:hypothetical protein
MGRTLPGAVMTRIPGAVEHALREAADSLAVLAADIQLSGPRPHQRAVTARVRGAMDTVDWIVGYDSTVCTHDSESAS